MKKELSKKLAAYSSVAGIALLGAKTSDAQIIYTNPPDILLSGAGAHSFIDLDNDGVFDLKIKIKFSYSSPQAYEAIIETPDSYRINVWDYSDCQGSFFYGYGVIPMNDGQLIPKNQGNQKDWQPASYGEIINFGYYGATCHRWAGANMKFAGLRIRDGYHKYHYAWMRLSVNETGSQVTIHDWAFDSQINHPFHTGQTMKLANEDPQSSSDLQIYSYEKEIIINQNSQNTPLEISVFNLLGEELQQLNSSDEIVRLNMKLDPGIYVVKVKSATEISGKQVVIE